MANEASFPPNMQPAGIPMTFAYGNIASGSTLNCVSPFSPGCMMAMAVDVAIVAAITSGYVQFYDSYTGASIWTANMDGTQSTYASWRGLYVFEQPGESGGELKVFNNTTSAAGIHISGLFLPYPGKTAMITQQPQAPS